MRLLPLLMRLALYMSLPDANLEVGGFSGGENVDQRPVWKLAGAVSADPLRSANPRGA